MPAFNNLSLYSNKALREIGKFYRDLNLVEKARPYEIADHKRTMEMPIENNNALRTALDAIDSDDVDKAEDEFCTYLYSASASNASHAPLHNNAYYLLEPALRYESQNFIWHQYLAACMTDELEYLSIESSYAACTAGILRAWLRLTLSESGEREWSSNTPWNKGILGDPIIYPYPLNLYPLPNSGIPPNNPYK